MSGRQRGGVPSHSAAAGDLAVDFRREDCRVVAPAVEVDESSPLVPAGRRLGRDRAVEIRLAKQPHRLAHHRLRRDVTAMRRSWCRRGRASVSNITLLRHLASWPIVIFTAPLFLRDILDVKPIRITRHARNRMRLYRIDDSLVEQTVRGAEWQESIAAGRMNAWMAVGERFLRVTYREEIDRIVVISAVFKRLPLLERG